MHKTSRRLVRLFLERDLDAGPLQLEAPEAHYLTNVLRLKHGDDVRVFNGRGDEFAARIEHLTRRAARLELVEAMPALPESRLDLTLIQAVTKGDAMDTIVQKATELGVSAIFPVTTDFSVVKLDPERASKRLEHWRKIARGACEQSGRHRPPSIRMPADLETCLSSLPDDATRLAFDPQAGSLPAERAAAKPRKVCALIGPEGGLSRADSELVDRAGFVRVRMGRRILRADTAAIAVCALVQHRWGDLN